MQIKLKVVQCPPESEMTGQTLSIEEEGATIGRAATNTFALPDSNRYVSSLHAKIQFNGQRFEIVDQSTNGTFLNNLSQALVKGQPTPLSNGDQILMGPFVLEVVTEGAHSPAMDVDTTSVSATLSGYDSLSVPGEEPAGLDDLDRWLEPSSPEAPPKAAPVIPDSNNSDDSLISSGEKELDPLSALGRSSDASADLDLSLNTGLGIGGLAEGNMPEGGLLDGGQMDVPGVIPDDWDKSIIHPASPRKPAPQKPVTPKQAPVQKAPPPPPKAPPATGSLLDLVNTPEDQLPTEPEADLFAPVPPAESDPAVQNVPPPATGKIPTRDPLSDSLLEQKFGAELPSVAPGEGSQSPWLQEPSGAPAPGAKQIEDDSLDNLFAKPAEATPRTKLLSDEEEVSPAPLVQPSPPPQPVTPPESLIPETPAEKPADKPKAPMPKKSGGMSSQQALELAQALGLINLSDAQREQLVPLVAEVVRMSVEGMMQALRARQTIKNEFRMNLTMIQAVENNPLKFSLSPDDALENLFAKQGKAYLSAADATKEAFADISDHQLALFNGIRGAYDQLMNHFSPERLEKRFARQRGKSLFGGSGKNWEAYQELFQEMNEDPEKTFRNLFGETFAEHYERSFNELKGKRKK